MCSRRHPCWPRKAKALRGNGAGSASPQCAFWPLSSHSIIWRGGGDCVTMRGDGDSMDFHSRGTGGSQAGWITHIKCLILERSGCHDGEFKSLLWRVCWHQAAILFLYCTMQILQVPRQFMGESCRCAWGLSRHLGPTE